MRHASLFQIIYFFEHVSIYHTDQNFLLLFNKFLLIVIWEFIPQLFLLLHHAECKPYEYQAIGENIYIKYNDCYKNHIIYLSFSNFCRSQVLVSTCSIIIDFPRFHFLVNNVNEYFQILNLLLKRYCFFFFYINKLYDIFFQNLFNSSIIIFYILTKYTQSSSTIIYLLVRYFLWFY